MNYKCIIISLTLILIFISCAIALDISGTWTFQSVYGSNVQPPTTMNLTQFESGDVRGTYNSASGLGNIQGTLQGNTWNGMFSDPGDYGPFVAYFADDGNSFNGRWDTHSVNPDPSNPNSWNGTWSGTRALYSLDGFVYNDINGNGYRDQNEPGLSGWMLTLETSPGVTGTTYPTATTDDTGHYSFTGLAPGTYTLSEMLQDGWTQTYPKGGIRAIIINNHDVTGMDFGNQEIPPSLQPAGSQPVGSQPTGPQPSGLQPFGSQPVGSQPTGPQTGGLQPFGSQPSGLQPFGSQPAGTQTGGATVI